MSLHTIEDLTSCILDFQANIIRVTYRKKTTPVDPDNEHSHAEALEYIWESSRLEEDIDEDGHPILWRKLGFETEDIIAEFDNVGELGLECFVSPPARAPKTDGSFVSVIPFAEEVCSKRSRLFQGNLICPSIPCVAYHIYSLSLNN